MAQLTAAMLKEGTLKHSSAQAGRGGRLPRRALRRRQRQRQRVDQHAGIERALRRGARAGGRGRDQARVRARSELDKLKKRELARLELQMASPRFLATREFSKAAVRHASVRARRHDQSRREEASSARTWSTWHGAHFAPNNAFLIVVGDVTPEKVAARAERAFAGWTKKPVAPAEYPRRLCAARAGDPGRSPCLGAVCDLIGNLALPRNDPNYIPLMVANQVLGGSAASRLVHGPAREAQPDLRRVLRVDERVGLGAVQRVGRRAQRSHRRTPCKRSTSISIASSRNRRAQTSSPTPSATWSIASRCASRPRTGSRRSSRPARLRLARRLLGSLRPADRAGHTGAGARGRPELHPAGRKP